MNYLSDDTSWKSGIPLVSGCGGGPQSLNAGGGFRPEADWTGVVMSLLSLTAREGGSDLTNIRQMFDSRSS